MRVAEAPARHFIDFHNHVLAGVDDGARDVEESRAAVGRFVDAGAQAMIATPHFDASLVEQPHRFSARMALLDGAWDELSGWAAGAFPALHVARGVELKLDVPDPDCSDPRLRLAGGRFILVEFPAMRVPLHSEVPLNAVVEQGFIPVLAHPERYSGFDEGLRCAHEWKNAGALLQVNAGSLNGRYGSRPRDHALKLLEAGLADYVCSDYHARGMLETERVLSQMNDDDASWVLLLRANAQRLLDGREPAAVPAPGNRRWWHSVARTLGFGTL